jgi:hypothetical protein
LEMLCSLCICFGAAYAETSLAVPIYLKQILLNISARKKFAETRPLILPGGP